MSHIRRAEAHPRSKIVPHLWFVDEAVEAANFYVFGNTPEFWLNAQRSVKTAVLIITKRDVDVTSMDFGFYVGTGFRY